MYLYEKLTKVKDLQEYIMKSVDCQAWKLLELHFVRSLMNNSKPFQSTAIWLSIIEGWDFNKPGKCHQKFANNLENATGVDRAHCTHVPNYQKNSNYEI